MSTFGKDVDRSLKIHSLEQHKGQYSDTFFLVRYPFKCLDTYFWLDNVSKNIGMSFALGHLWTVSVCDLERQCSAECDPEGYSNTIVSFLDSHVWSGASTELWFLRLKRSLSFSFATKKRGQVPENKTAVFWSIPPVLCPKHLMWMIHTSALYSHRELVAPAGLGIWVIINAIFCLSGSIRTVTAWRGRQLRFVKWKYRSSSIKCQCSTVFVAKL